MNKIEEWMNSRIGLNFRSGLGRMERAVDLLGRPDQAYPIIHVTGTNGKGSTIAFMNQLFGLHGLRVGTFTSPHMISIHDRICIGGIPISEEDFVRIGEQVQAMEADLVPTHDPLSYFEIITLMALLYFKEEAVDLVLLEVGIGGLLDTTNVVTGELALITSIGLDHQETLGSTIAEIAQQKAGIFKKGKKALVGPVPEEAKVVCQDEAEERGTDVYQYGRDFGLDKDRIWTSQLDLDLPKLGLEGRYQKENACLAVTAFVLMMQEWKRPIDRSLLCDALEKTLWPGRLEAIGGHVFLDGAHNPHAIKRLIEFIKEIKGKRVQILFGALKRKDYQGMLGLFKEELPDVELILTTFNYGEVVEQGDQSDLPYVADYQAYLRDFQVQAQEDQLIFVTGSLYFIAEVREFLLSDQKG